MADQNQSTEALRTISQVSIEQERELTRHRVALIRVFQTVRGCTETGRRCQASEDCACCQDYEIAVQP
jgi:hypothetical protein